MNSYSYIKRLSRRQERRPYDHVVTALLHPSWLFIREITQQPFDASRLISIDPDTGNYSLLLPDGIAYNNSLTFTKISFVAMKRRLLSAKIGYVRNILKRAVRRPLEETSWNISQTYNIMHFDESSNFMAARTVGKDRYEFFCSKVFDKRRVKKVIYKRLWRLYEKRADGIEEAVRKKKGCPPWGFLFKLVKFFRKIAEICRRAYEKLLCPDLPGGKKLTKRVRRILELRERGVLKDNSDIVIVEGEVFT